MTTLSGHPVFVCSSCGGKPDNPNGTLRVGDLTVCARTGRDAEIKEVK